MTDEKVRIGADDELDPTLYSDDLPLVGTKTRLELVIAGIGLVALGVTIGLLHHGKKQITNGVPRYFRKHMRGCVVIKLIIFVTNSIVESLSQQLTIFGHQLG